MIARLHIATRFAASVDSWDHDEAGDGSRRLG